MAERNSYAHGDFNWVDLATDNPDAAKTFYSALFGWSFVDDIDESGNIYSLGLKNDRPVVGLMAKTPEMVEMGVPNVWETYIKVDDADAALAGVEPAGGTPMGPVMQAAQAGRLAVVTDPTGGVVMLWEPIDHQGAHFKSEHGALCWNELVTSDVDAAMAFYSAVLGWTPVKMGDGGVVGIRQGTEIIGTATPAPHDGVPSHWAVYLAVNDCDAVADHCRSLGGSVNVAPMDTPPGRMAQLADDQGAIFWVITPDPDFSMD
ncbi:VOC family protein [Candidatus Poriferisocius sp.]|uniref:VOC family protein n=1 Tax=Candidatus Poriferisocius sp. TaxID=3101276 RepID=UPI003B0247AA